MTLAATAEHATAADATLSPSGVTAWNGTGAHTVQLSGTADVTQGGTGAATAIGACASLKAVHVLASSGESLSGAADTNENVLATVAVPANAMGANGTLRVTTHWTVNNNGNAKTVRVRFSGASGTEFLSASIANTVNFKHQLTITNRNDTSAQIGSPVILTAFGISANAAITAAVDTTAATTVVFSAQKGNGADTMTLNHYSVELITP